MNVRLSFLLVAVLLIVGGAVVITQVVPDDKERRPQVDWIYKMDVDDIYGISVVHQDTLQVYDRQGGWAVGHHRRRRHPRVPAQVVRYHPDSQRPQGQPTGGRYHRRPGQIRGW